MTRFPALLLAASALVAMAGCAGQRPPPSRTNAAAVAACRAETDRVYAAQNRVELSQRDSRDTPFASSYNSGITSRGLGAAFGRANMMESCVAQSTGGRSGNEPAPPAITGPTFSSSPTAAVR